MWRWLHEVLLHTLEYKSQHFYVLFRVFVLYVVVPSFVWNETILMLSFVYFLVSSDYRTVFLATCVVRVLAYIITGAKIHLYVFVRCSCVFVRAAFSSIHVAFSMNKQ